MASNASQEAPQHDNMVTVSAPGKVLMTGGYLVLEQPNVGLVLAANKRFYTTVTARPPLAVDAAAASGTPEAPQEREQLWINVYSPQFERNFCYSLEFSATQLGNLTLQPTGLNPFLERTLWVTLTFAQAQLGPHAFSDRLQAALNKESHKEKKALAIQLRADNDFYSLVPHLPADRRTWTPEAVEQLPRFLKAVNKTGLGSSAALVTSLVGALLKFLGVVPDLTSPSSLAVTHNVAQLSHCAAQGKVGSGFDVSAAIYGSHIYTRFAAAPLEPLLHLLSEPKSEPQQQQNQQQQQQQSEQLSYQLQNTVLANQTIWSNTVRPVQLPKGMELLLADVCGGSESPSMARKVLAWKKQQPPSPDLHLWDSLQVLNQRITCILTEEMMSQKFERLLQRFQRLLSQHSAADWGALEGDEDNEDDDDYDTNEDVMNDFVGEENDLAWLVGKLLRLRVACNEARTCLRKVGELAGVPIEPPSQTQLANATLALPGVLCAGVPGAGGYDALYCIYIRGTPTTPHSDTVRDQIASTWRQWTPLPPKQQGQVQTNDDNDAITVVCPLAVRAAGSGPQDGICETTLDW